MSSIFKTALPVVVGFPSEFQSMRTGDLFYVRGHENEPPSVFVGCPGGVPLLFHSVPDGRTGEERYRDYCESLFGADCDPEMERLGVEADATYGRPSLW